jgi:hypothetical protein
LGTQKIENSEKENHILDLLRTGTPANTGWIAEKIGCCWSTAKILLLDMVRQGKITVIRTSVGYIFSLPENTPNPEGASPIESAKGDS